MNESEIRSANALSTDHDPAWRTWLMASVAAWIVFTHVVGIISDDPQSLVAESSGWGAVAQWGEHCLILIVMLFVLVGMIRSLAHRYRRP